MFRATLYFFYQNGCSHCARAEPEVTRFSLKNMSKVLVMKINGAKRSSVKGFTPQGTPAYLLAVGEEAVWTHEGIVSEKKLQTALDKAERDFKKGLLLEEDDEDAIPKTRKGKEDFGDDTDEDEAE